MMTGAWTAWHRNPPDSARPTRRAAVIILLTVAAVAGLIVVTVRLTLHRSASIAAFAVALAVVVGTLALLLFIQAATVSAYSAPAALPQSIRLITNNRVKMYRWLRLFAVLLVIFLPGCLVPGLVRYLSLSLGGVTLLLALVQLPIFYFTNRGVEQSLAAIEANPWLCWSYLPEQWQTWSAVQAERLRPTLPKFVLRRDWRTVLFPTCSILLGVAFFAPGPWIFRGICVLPICGAILTLALLSRHRGDRQADDFRARLLQAQPAAWFGRDGIFCDGVFTPWLNVSNWLVSARVDERIPRSLLFEFARSVPDPYGPSQTMPIHQAVLIPEHAEADLARLQRELTARCPKARINLT